MRYMLLIYSDEQQWADMTPEDAQKVYADYMNYSQELIAAGVLVDGSELKPTRTARTLRAKGGTVATTDGPFAETREQLGGYYLLNVPDLEAAEKWAAKCPGVQHGAIEVRACAMSATGQNA